MTAADNDDLFRRVNPIELARQHADMFTPEFLLYLPSNLHVYEAFEREAFKVVAKGFVHYSARTIIEVLRHNSALAERGGPWKLNDHVTPSWARLFALMNPQHAEFFEYRHTKAMARRRGTAANDPQVEAA